MRCAPVAATRSATSTTRSSSRRETLRAGFQAGFPFAVAAGVLAISFGVLARPVMGTVAPIVMSAVVFAGSAQFAATAGLGAGGGGGTGDAPRVPPHPPFA